MAPSLETGLLKDDPSEEQQMVAAPSNRRVLLAAVSTVLLLGGGAAALCSQTANVAQPVGLYGTLYGQEDFNGYLAGAPEFTELEATVGNLTATVSALLKEDETLKEELENLERQPGPASPAGPNTTNATGPSGEPGTAGPLVQYGDTIYLQVQNVAQRWFHYDVNGPPTTEDDVNGPRTEDYQWQLRSTNSAGDPKQGLDVKYGDLVYLLHQTGGWLSGADGPGGHYMRMSSGSRTDKRFQWQIRSSAGSGEVGAGEPKQGLPVAVNDIIYLQVQKMSQRWLAGGVEDNWGQGNKGAKCLDLHNNDIAAFEWQIRTEIGDGSVAH